MATQPDLAHPVVHLAQFSQCPSEEHLTALKHVFRYLKGTIDMALHYNTSEDLKVYSDTDWAGDANNQRSVSGYIMLCAGAAVSWSSRKQITVVLSTMEAEYIALASLTREVIWLRQLGSELGLDTTNPTVI